LDAAETALDAWRILRTTCVRIDDGSASLLEGPGADRAPLWPTSQALAAAADVAELTGDYADTLLLIDGLRAFRSGEGYAPCPGQRRRYFDDNAWIGLAQTQLHLQTGDPGYLAEARRVFGFVATGQEPDGGVRWRERTSSLHTCSTAPAAQLALRLFLLTGDRRPLEFAHRAMGWLDRAMRLPSGLMADHIGGKRVDPTVRSYNQGSALGAFALGSRTEATDARLDDAMRIAAASLAHFVGDVLWRQPPVFNAIWFRNLLALNVVEAVPGLAEALDTYLDRVFREARDRTTGLFTAGGIGSYDGTPAIDHAGLVQLFALRAWRPERLVDVG
jgi:Predicted glycosyl hydrolase